MGMRIKLASVMRPGMCENPVHQIVAIGYVESLGIPAHVELESQSWQQVDKGNAHSGCHGPVVESINPVTPVVRRAASDVVVDASEGP